MRADLNRILAEAHLPRHAIAFELKGQGANRVKISCPTDRRIVLQVEASPTEWSSTVYYGLQRLGFLFPHPKIQISPEPAEMRKQCGNTFTWEPRVRYRGFHLHTPHPNEWVPGFLGDETEIAQDTIRWLARNGQNVVEVRLLRTAYPELIPWLNEAIDYAHDFGIYFGVGASFSMVQQKSFHLISPLRAVSGIGDQQNLERRLHELLDALDFDYLMTNLGTSEFTTTNTLRTLNWIETASKTMRENGRQLFVPAHVSTGLHDDELGNFNFLAQHGGEDVGILAHTVMFYSLQDEKAPVYGRENFSDMRELLVAQAGKRPIWYYPETSYFIGMDIDIPLFLTDYLKARSEDYDYIVEQGVDGHITFTTGQELGYWLMDWSVALYTQERFAGDPTAALQLLGEDREVWDAILDFQTKHFKDNQLIAMLSGATLLDELPLMLSRPVHERTLLKRLAVAPALRREEEQRLEAALKEAPPTEGIRNDELRMMVEVTFERIRHAYSLRRALAHCWNCTARKTWLSEASERRTTALKVMANLIGRYNRYPSARIFERHENFTGYGFGYGWPAAQLHFWEREERMVERDVWAPWFMNIYDIFGVVF